MSSRSVILGAHVIKHEYVQDLVVHVIKHEYVQDLGVHVIKHEYVQDIRSSRD
jgi:hypothetical protein